MALHKCIWILTVLLLHASAVWGQESTFFLESFDEATPPALPFGWEDAAGEWTTSSSVASGGSGENNLTASGSQSASIQTPIVNLTGLTGGTIEYLARRTSTYPQDSLLVLASIDGGTTFSITLLDRGEALPSADGGYEMISMAVPADLLGQADVVFQFIALGGTTSGSNIRIDDVHVLGNGDPTAGNSVFGFSTESSTLDQGTNLVQVPVFLDFENEESLQGVQLDISWDVPELTVSAILPGGAVSDPADWSLSFNVDGAQLDALLLGNESASLSQGVYDPLFTIEFSLPEPSSSIEAILTLNSAIGSLAVVTGDDAGLILGQQIHSITLDPGDAIFSPSATELDAGLIEVSNTAEVFLTVSNLGNTDLVINDVVSSSALFSVSPIIATVPAGSSQEFVIAFSPSFTEFGVQTSTLTFLHNADGGSTDIIVSGTGTGGRGDASRDGAVDVLDLVLGIDYALDVTLPDEGQITSTDLFPFEISDGTIDVRDLTVLSQAILSGSWPDGVPLPIAPAASSIAGKADAQLAFVQPHVTGSGSTLTLSTLAPVRAVQFAISMDTPLGEPYLPVSMPSNLTTQWMYDPWEGELRVLAVRMDGGFLEPGEYPLLVLPGLSESVPMQLASGIAVVAGPERVALSWLDAKETEVLNEEAVDAEWIGLPYPNPFLLSEARSVTLPFRLTESQSVQVEVFDLLGRQIAVLQDRRFGSGDHLLVWNGQDHKDKPVAAGLYLFRVSTSERTVTRLILVR